MSVTLQPTREVVTLLPQGMTPVLLGGTERPVISLELRQGPPGPKGLPAARYLHTQASPELTWIVNHDLNLFPIVAIFSPGGLEIEAAVQHLNQNQAEIRFSAATSGYAVCQ